MIRRCTRAILTLIVGSLTLGCTTFYRQGQVTVNRSQEEVRQAAAAAESKLGKAEPFLGYWAGPGTAGPGGWFLSPVDPTGDEAQTSFSLPPNTATYLADIQRKALLQEIYLAEGHAIPPNPSQYQEKSWLAAVGLFELNVGLGYHYAYDNNAFINTIFDQSTKKNLAVEYNFVGFLDGLGAVAAVGGALVSALSDGNNTALGRTSGFIALLGLGGWAAVRLGSAPLAFSSLATSVIKPHNYLLKTGYNWDPNFRVEDNLDIDYSISATTTATSTASATKAATIGAAGNPGGESLIGGVSKGASGGAALPSNSGSPSESIPIATMKVDGNFDDWKNIEPMLLGARVGEGDFGIDKVYLAEDSENLYLKFDITDSRASSFFHYSNFNTSHNSTYGIDIMDGSKFMTLTLDFDHKNGQWAMQMGRMENGKWALIEKNPGNYVMRGSSLEARFPIKVVRHYFQTPVDGNAYYFVATTGYNDSHWNWVQDSGESTPSKRLFIK